MATSAGHVDMTIDWWKESKTIYKLIADRDFSAKIHYNDSTTATTYGGMIDRRDKCKSIDPPFAFDRLGVGVPAVPISPYIAPGTVISTVFDNSSLAATARKVFLGEGVG